MLNQLIQKSIENENQAPKALNIPYFLRFSIEMLRKYNEQWENAQYTIARKIRKVIKNYFYVAGRRKYVIYNFVITVMKTNAHKYIYAFM